MTLDDTEAETSSDTDEKDSHLSVPFTLKEFGEIPEGYVSVFIQVDKSDLKKIAEGGFKVDNNKMIEGKPGVESVFSTVAKEMDIDADRTRCVFAYPRHPDTIASGFSFDPEEEVIVEAMINPSGVVVANGDHYSEAVDVFKSDPDFAADWARKYWGDSKPLEQYLNENHTGLEDDRGDFGFPEVLIPVDIPTSRLKVVIEPEESIDIS